MGMSISEYRLTKKPKPLKYRNRPVEVDGERYRSQKEYRFHAMCKAQTKAADPRQRIVKIEREVYFLLVPTQRSMYGKLLERKAGYYLDFRVTFADGHVDHVDTKSPATRKIPSYIMKRKLMLDRHKIHVMEV